MKKLLLIVLMASVLIQGRSSLSGADGPATVGQIVVYTMMDGTERPALITGVAVGTANLQVFLDASLDAPMFGGSMEDVAGAMLTKGNVPEGSGPGTWHPVSP